MWVDYEPQPKNIFTIRVNDADFYSLVKEEADFDPTKTENLYVILKINGECALRGNMPWIIDDVSDKVESALGMNHLTTLDIESLNCKSCVANEFLDFMCSYDLPEQGLEKITLNDFKPACEPFEDEVATRMAAMCHNLTHL